MLWLLLPAFADPPSDEALAAICAGRTPCRHVSHQYAGTDPLGLDLQVVELLLSDTEESEARGPAYGGECAPFEWHVVRYDADEKLAGHRKLLELCNDGYGASGVGDDRVEVSDNRLVHDQMGGSSWRWSQGQAVQLWPERVLEEWTGSWRSPMGHTQETRWSWVSRSGWQSVELVSCDSQESPDDAEPLAVAGPVIPRVPEQEGPGPCGATVHAGNDRGLVIHGSPSTPDDGRIVVARQGERQLVVDVFDDVWVPTAERWIFADHLELWLPDGHDPNDIHCLETRWPARQWGVTTDGTVHPGHGDPPTNELQATAVPIDGGHRFTLTLPPDTDRLAVVFSDSDDGTSQERLIATSTLQAGNAHTLLGHRAVDARCTPDGVLEESWDPRWDRIADDLSPTLLGHRQAWERIDTVEAFVAAWSAAHTTLEQLNPVSQRWFEQSNAESPDLRWTAEQLPGWHVDLYGEGSVLLWELSVDPWKAKAAATPGEVDDRFVRLMALAWGNLSFTSLPRWYTLTWDGGGCNDLGDGEFLAVLKATEGDWPPALQPAVAGVRSAALKAITGPTINFAFCDGDSTDERTPEELEGEVDRILAEVTLTAAERKLLTERRAAGFGPGEWPEVD